MRTVVARMLRHLFYNDRSVRRTFPEEAFAAIDREITASEGRHNGEIVFAVESSLRLRDLFRSETARDRAMEVFSRLRVWDTGQNNGVLIYVLLADRQVEIVADRGVHGRVGEQAWESICAAVQKEFHTGRFLEGAVAGVQAVGDLLAEHYAPTEDDTNELPNRPRIVGN